MIINTIYLQMSLKHMHINIFFNYYTQKELNIVNVFYVNIIHNNITTHTLIIGLGMNGQTLSFQELYKLYIF